MSELTLEEKLQCLGTGNPAIERLGIDVMWHGGEGAHGLQARRDQSFDQGMPQPTTTFPNPNGMSATWDRELVRQAGVALGNEARALRKKSGRGSLCLWAPTVDMERDPRWGRTEEAYGEDPYLAGEMAASYVKGMRGDDATYIRCAATLKHFYANNVEDGRVYKSSSVDPRNREEYYLEPFRRAVTEGGAEAMMTSYNEINGIPAMLNPEVQKRAKEEWGLYHVVSDGGDVLQTVNEHHYFASHAETIAAALKAGLDCFTDDIGEVSKAAREALNRGMITIDDIDRALRCHFSTNIRLGLFDEPGLCPYDAIGEEYLNCEEHRNVARTLSRESVVLLKNEGILPLESQSGQKIAVVGPLADQWDLDWYSGLPPYYVKPLAGIASHVKKENLKHTRGLLRTRIRLEDGTYLGILDGRGTVGAVPDRKQAEVFEWNVWDDHQITLRACSNDRYLTVDDGENPEHEKNSMKIYASRKQAFGWFVKEAFHVAQGEMLTDMLREGQAVCVRSWKDDPFVIDDEGCLKVLEDAGAETETLSWTPELVSDGVSEAVSLAQWADCVIMVGGAHPMITCKEEVDRADIGLSPLQSELIRAIYDKQKKMILALISSVPLAVNWEQEHLSAIVAMAGGGMELGNGLADILFGCASPAGRLNMTWYRDVADLPDMDDYDIIQGERTYQYFQGDVLYPFGHGLSYTEMKYENLQVELQDLVTWKVRVDVSNVGGCVSDEVVQLYVHKVDPLDKRPVRQLKGFCRVKDLAPGETRTVEFAVPEQDLKYYDVVRRQMVLEDGDYLFEVGASSQDIRLNTTVNCHGVKPASRDAREYQPADHYHESGSVMLGEGIRGYASVMPASGQDAMELLYRRIAVASLTDAACLVVECECNPGDEISLWMEDHQIGHMICGEDVAQYARGTRFCTLRIPLHWTKEDRERLEAAACSGECPETADGRPGAEGGRLCAGDGRLDAGSGRLAAGGGSAEAGEDVTDWTIHCQGRVRLAAWHVE